MKISRGEKWFHYTNNIVLGLFAILCFLPFIYVLAQSFSSHRAVASGEVLFWPIEFHTAAYAELFKDDYFLHSFLISIGRTVIGTLINIALTCLLAYPLSKAYIKGRGVILMGIVFTMLFNGGMIPTYLVVRATGLLDTIWALILPTAISAFNVMIMKTFFQSVPNELEESARIDGCSNLGILIRIVVPLSMPAIATISLFHAVAHWNAYFDAVLYIMDRDLYPVQVYLRELIQFDQTDINLKDDWESQLIATETLKAAALLVSTLPILMVYPFLQKYFVKGALIGSVKG
ncbi:carbohydrate ABC transporter permease [Paenibacillus chungangensis]|uniref:Carbohydrate ABC transporter permease n=1 Tax=Paenibacillus chungangensis TaxID=696535 RepID=A0ABW3HUT5_9BACL